MIHMYNYVYMIYDSYIYVYTYVYVHADIGEAKDLGNSH